MEFLKVNLTSEEYKRLVVETCGTYIPHVQHNIIVCKDKNNIAGVFNYYRYGIDSLFLHRAWYSNEYYKKIKKIKYWYGFYAHVKESGYKYIMGVIDGQNKPALIWALKTGFDITGIRQTTDHKLIIDIIKRL